MITSPDPSIDLDSDDGDEIEANPVIEISADFACRLGICGPPMYDDQLVLTYEECQNPENKMRRVSCSDIRMERYLSSISKYAAFIERETDIDLGLDLGSEELGKFTLFFAFQRCDAEPVCMLDTIASIYRLLRRRISSNALLKILEVYSSEDVTGFSAELTEATIRNGNKTAWAIVVNDCGGFESCEADRSRYGALESFTYNFAAHSTLIILSAGLLTLNDSSELDRYIRLDRVGSVDCIIRPLCDDSIGTDRIPLTGTSASSTTPLGLVQSGLE